MLEEILSRSNSDTSLLFYPSSGWRLKNVLDLPCEQFIFADKGPQSQSKKSDFIDRLVRSIEGCHVLDTTPDGLSFRKDLKFGLVVFKDNNDVLQNIIETGRNIDCFVGVRDGCVEGGNKECVNDLPFFKKVLPLTPSSGMTYFTDHSHLLSNLRPNTAHLNDAPRPEVIINGKRLLRVGVSDRRLTRSPWGPIYKYSITHHARSIREWNSNGLRVTLEHDTIADHLDGLDGVYVSTRCRKLFETSNMNSIPNIRGAPDYYFMPSLRKEWGTEDSVRSLLELCEEEKWNVVGTTAFGEDQHRGTINVLESWKGACPEWIRIFHFDRKDFHDLDDMFHVVTPTISQ